VIKYKRITLERFKTMIIQIPEKVEYIINTLIKHGFEAYAVGGCVRDSILGRIPEDWDITTSAKPEEIKKIFRRTVDTGIQHGTVTIMLDKDGFEITTYRIDGKYEDSRHPTEVKFTTSLIEDLKRRDFTINAMAYNAEKGIIDQFGGIRDIKSRIIRCVGNPEDRFDEDALRMLRAIRFSGQLGFLIDQETRNAIEQKADNIQNISGERIRTELNKLLISNEPEKLKEAYLTGITKKILPELDVMMSTKQNNPHHIYGVGDHSLKAVFMVTRIYKERQEYDEKIHSILCWTMLFHDVAKPICRTTGEDGIDHFWGHQEKGVEMVRNILRRLKFDNYTIEMVSRLIKWHDYRFILSPTSIRRAINKIGVDIMKYLFVIKWADIAAQNPDTFKEKSNLLIEAEKMYRESLLAKDCVSLKTLNINGRDLIEIGIPAGIEVGIILKNLLEQVLENPDLNKKERLLDKARQLKMKETPVNDN
jgi:tRNA nucleotidyltransferase (CCA-adding enzyme)